MWVFLAGLKVQDLDGICAPSTVPQAFHAIWAGTGQPSFHSVKEQRDTLGYAHYRPDYFDLSSGSSPLHGYRYWSWERCL